MCVGSYKGMGGQMQQYGHVDCAGLLRAERAGFIRSQVCNSNDLCASLSMLLAGACQLETRWTALQRSVRRLVVAPNPSSPLSHLLPHLCHFGLGILWIASPNVLGHAYGNAGRTGALCLREQWSKCAKEPRSEVLVTMF